MKSGIERLAKRIQESMIGEESTFILKNEIGDEIQMGVKTIRQFDFDIAVIGAFGGGYEMAIWIDENNNDCKYVIDKLQKEYEGCKIFAD